MTDGYTVKRFGFLHDSHKIELKKKTVRASLGVRLYNIVYINRYAIERSPRSADRTAVVLYRRSLIITLDYNNVMPARYSRTAIIRIFLKNYFFFY